MHHRNPIAGIGRDAKNFPVSPSGRRHGRDAFSPFPDAYGYEPSLEEQLFASRQSYNDALDEQAYGQMVAGSQLQGAHARAQTALVDLEALTGTDAYGDDFWGRLRRQVREPLIQRGAMRVADRLERERERARIRAFSQNYAARR